MSFRSSTGPRNSLILSSHSLLALATAMVVVVVLRPPASDRSEPAQGSADATSSSSSHLAQEQDFPGVGAILRPPPPASQPSVDAQSAIEVVRTDGMRPDIQAKIEPTANLASFTNTILGQPGGSSLGPPKYVDLLVWDVTFPDAPQQLYGPGDLSALKSAPCDLHVIVNAATGEIIEGFQAQCQVSGLASPGPSLSSAAGR